MTMSKREQRLQAELTERVLRAERGVTAAREEQRRAEESKARTEKQLADSIAETCRLRQALREEAVRARAFGQSELARLFEAAAQDRLADRAF